MRFREFCALPRRGRGAGRCRVPRGPPARRRNACIDTAPPEVPYLSHQNDSLRVQFAAVAGDVPASVPFAEAAFGEAPEPSTFDRRRARRRRCTQTTTKTCTPSCAARAVLPAAALGGTVSARDSVPARAVPAGTSRPSRPRPDAPAGPHAAGPHAAGPHPAGACEGDGREGSFPAGSSPAGVSGRGALDDRAREARLCHGSRSTRGRGGCGPLRRRGLRTRGSQRAFRWSARCGRASCSTCPLCGSTGSRRQTRAPPSRSTTGTT